MKEWIAGWPAPHPSWAGDEAALVLGGAFLLTLALMDAHRRLAKARSQALAAEAEAAALRRTALQAARREAAR